MQRAKRHKGTFSRSAFFALALTTGPLATGVLATCTAAQAADDMTFRPIVLQDGRAALVASGAISSETPESFQQARGADRALLVLLDSPGGNVDSAMRLGRLFRQAGVTVIVASPSLTGAQCFSACVYALMGARSRIVPPQSQIGIHRMVGVPVAADTSGASTDVDMDAEHRAMRAALVRYAQRMGVNPAVIAWAERTSSQDLRILSQAEIRQWHLATSRR